MEKMKHMMESPVIVDCKNLFSRREREGILYIGIGRDSRQEIHQDDICSLPTKPRNELGHI